MGDSHKYTILNWMDFYEDKLDDKDRIEMTQHLQGCSQCLEYYAYCVETNISPAPLELRGKVMKRVKKPYSTKKIMIAYATAACIATGVYSVGWLDKTIGYAPKGIEKSLGAISVISENVNHVTNKLIWRDFNEKEK